MANPPCARRGGFQVPPRPEWVSRINEEGRCMDAGARGRRGFALNDAGQERRMDVGIDASRTKVSRKAVQAMLDAAIARDMARFWSCFTEDVVVYEPSYLPYGGTYRGMSLLLQ